MPFDVSSGSMPATNAKLRKRASLMVELGAEVDPATAARALEDSGGEIRTAIVVARKGVKPDEKLKPQKLSKKEAAQLKAFLESLTGEPTYGKPAEPIAAQ